MFDWKNFFNDFADRYYAVPDFNNKQHVYALQNYLIEQGMLTEDVDYAIKTLLGEGIPRPKNAWNEREIHRKDEEERVSEAEGKFTARAQSGKVTTFGSEETRDAAIQKGTHTKVDKDSEEPTDDIDRDSKGYKAGKQKFDDDMEIMVKQIQFENDKEKEIFGNVLDKIKKGNLEFTDEEKTVAQKYMAKSDSATKDKFYIARKGGGTYDAKTTRGQIPVQKGGFSKTYVPFMDDIVKTLELGKAPAQAQTAGKVKVPSKIRTKELTPTRINSKEDLNVKLNKDSDGNVVSVTFGSRDHKIKSIPDKQKLKQAFIGKGMSEESAEKKARKVRRSIRKHNEYLKSISQDRDKFTVSTMIEGADPSTEEGRQEILNKYPEKLGKIFEDIVKKSPKGISEDEQKVMNRIKNLAPNLGQEGSAEEYEKEAMAIMHEILSNSPALASGASDLAEHLIALIQIRKGHEVYFPADVTYKVGDMICLGSIGDLDPTAKDYYDKLADEASSIIVTVENEGPGSIKVNAGAASSAEEKIKLTEYKNPKTRNVLNRIVETHQDLFNKTPVEVEEAKKKIDEAEDYARKIGIDKERVNQINDKSEKQARKWAEKYKKEGRTGTEDWTDKDWESYIKTATQYMRAHLLLGEINNADMDYQKFTNFRVNNSKTKGASMSRTDGVDCLGTMKPAPNMGFTFKPKGRFAVNNTYAGRIGNSCKDKKKD
jgi:hypothetical protein